MKLYWWRDQPNFGDAIAPLIAEKLFGLPIEWECEPGKWITAGSVLSCGKDGDTIWGTGCLHALDGPQSNKLHVLAVRGPLTRQVLLLHGIACPAVYGDPGLFLPSLFPRPSSLAPFSTIGLVPHWTEVDTLNKLLPRFACGDRVKVVDPRRPPAAVAAELASCWPILSSSLHGLVAADAYEIPSAFVRFVDEPLWYQRMLGKDRFKFSDYFQGFGRGDDPPPLVTEWRDLVRAADAARYTPPRIDKQRLLDAAKEALHATA